MMAPPYRPNRFRQASRLRPLERMYLGTARKSASDRSAPDAGDMVAEERHYPTNAAAPARRPREEPEKPQVSPARFFGSFLCEAQRNEHKFLNQRALCAAVCRRAKKFLLTYAHPATTRPGQKFFITFFACAKKVTQESTPRNLRFLWLFP